MFLKKLLLSLLLALPLSANAAGTFFWTCESTTLGANDFSAGDTTATASGDISISSSSPLKGSNSCLTTNNADYFILDAASIWSAGEASFAAMFRWTSSHPTGTAFPKLVMGVNAAGNDGAGFTHTGSPRPRMRLVNSSNVGTNLDITSGALLAADTTYFITGAYDLAGDRRYVRLYNSSCSLIYENVDTTTDLAGSGPSTITELRVGNDTGVTNVLRVDTVVVGSDYDDPVADACPWTSFYPTFTSALSAGTHTTTELEVTYTPDQPGTATVVACPNGQTANHAQILAHNCSGGAASAFFEEAGVAGVGETELLTGLSAGTTYDVFGTYVNTLGGAKASVSSLADQTTEAGGGASPDFDSGPTLNDCDATGCTFDYDANADADHIWGMCVSTAESTPSAAAIKAGTGSNGDADEASTGSADTLTISFTDSPVFPIYNCHFVAEEGTANFSSVVSVLSVMPDAPTGKAFWPILSIGTDSPCERFNTATSPDIAANDWLLSNDETDPGEYALTVANTCQFSYTGDESQQNVLDIGVYDASAGGWHADDIDFWANNTVPLCAPEDDPVSILLYKDEEMDAYDLEELGACFDNDLDELSYSASSGTFPTGTTLSGTGNKDWTGTPTVEDEAGEDITVEVADVPGDTTSYDIVVYVTDDEITAPDCVTGGVTAAECVAALNTLRPWLDSSDQLVATFSYSDTVAENDIISQDPAASATISATDLLSVSVSIGAAPVFDSTKSTQGLKFRKSPEGLRTR